MPDLNILDAIYILAHPSGGPWCTYAEATPTNKLVAGFDPVAIDMWATKNILVPAIIANGYSSYPMQNPDDPQSIFRRYLDLSMSELIAAGIQVTNDLTQIDAQVCQGAGIEPEESSPSSPPVVPHPNPGRSGRAITFDMPIASAVELDIYDARGRLVRSIRESVLQGPRHEIRWDGRDHRGNRLPAGTYIYRLRGGAEPATGKVTLVN